MNPRVEGLFTLKKSAQCNTRHSPLASLHEYVGGCLYFMLEVPLEVWLDAVREHLP